MIVQHYIFISIKKLLLINGISINISFSMCVSISIDFNIIIKMFINITNNICHYLSNL